MPQPTGRTPGPDRRPAGAAGLPARLLAWRLLQAVAAGAYADAALERELQRHPLAPADRALVTELAYGAIRQRRLLDAWLDAHGRVPAERQPPQLRWLLHVGLYQLLFSERVPASAAVHTTVELAKRHGLGRLAPVANGLLRAVLRSRGSATPATAPPWQGLSLPADPQAAFALRHSLPDWLAALLLQWLPLEQAEAVGQAWNSPPPLDLRCNVLRCSREALLEQLQTAGLKATALGDTTSGLSLSQGAGDLRQLPGYQEGHWCVQDRSAQAIAPLLQPQPGQQVLDACAAPGGKSTHLAELMGDQGQVWALDRSTSRLERVTANAARLGLASVQIEAADATSLASSHPDWRGRFQRILLDAPCSGLGTLARHADARWRMAPATIEELTTLQSQLLEAMAPLLAPGGRLVYATCTLHPAENGEQIAAFLARHTDWRLEQEQQWWPEARGGDGFYAAVLLGPS